MKQYQYRMKCRKAPNQNWSSWGDCGEAEARECLERAKDESNLWTYEVREIVPVTRFDPSEEEVASYKRAMSSIELEHKAMTLYYNSVDCLPYALAWKNLPASTIKYWLDKAGK